jgi:enamine deaminase RidA (YjgF/YER057c/UK114 family)
VRTVNPPAWPRPKGYANAVAAEGQLVFVAGQVGWNAEERIVSDDFVRQVRQALENVRTILAAAGAEPEHLARMTWFVTDKAEYQRRLREVGEAYRAVIGRHFPAMTLVEVRSLLEQGAKVEIEATAVVPRRAP